MRYIGKTRQELGQSISKHMHSMQIGNLYLPPGRHVARKCRYRIPKVNATVLDRVHITPRGGDWNKTLLQHEMRWIRHLNATTPRLKLSRKLLEGLNSGKTD